MTKIITSILAISFSLLGCTKSSPAEVSPSPQNKHRAELEAQARTFRARASASPKDVTHALVLARTLIELSRVASEPAFKDEAERAIGPFAERTPPVPEALILRATIRQSRHEFVEALSDLKKALELSPANAQGWVTLSVILGVRGEYEGALKACIPLRSIANPLAVAACEANILGVSGEATRAREELEKALGGAARISPAEKVWALSILAELCARIGDAPAAESAYQRALAAGVRDEYVLASYADFLLDAQKPAEVVKLLEKEANVDPLLLRLAIAEKELGSATAMKHAAMISAIFAQNRARGDLTHAREEARYLLEASGDRREALRIARENFAAQREPWDVRVLLTAALANGDRAAAQPALDFIDKTKLEDVRILALAEKVRALPGGN